MPTDMQKVFDQILAANPGVCLDDIRRLVPDFQSHSDDSLATCLMQARQRLSSSERGAVDRKVSSVRAVVDRLLACAHRDRRTIDPLQMQKLVYLAEGWTLALSGQSLFREPIEAWTHGPVVPELHQALRRFGAGPIDRELFASSSPMGAAAEAVLSNAEEIAIVDGIWDAYGAMSGPQLISLIGEPNSPWDATRRRAEGEKPDPVSRDAIGAWLIGRHGAGERGQEASRSASEAIRSAARSSVVVTGVSVDMHRAERSKAVRDAEGSDASLAHDVGFLRHVHRDHGGRRLLKPVLAFAAMALVSVAGLVLIE
ncbi:MAG: DUF4065 domain-containing protein [Reyranella sp.]|uniref:Panacea domain-containing protein n=1 Tax=Reyranella sp. TaxID=1929291 RepID=UPI002731539A|nr:type II toxin-antitoxin system antitoxin SocA domain-containing protein [Reyranella sp.]MDP1966436.1 DUF4065 domain-containing protein [Reyranella sp.]MDP2375847.1 DUF4065 domain-containing protein [Reyranella sp.]